MFVPVCNVANWSHITVCRMLRGQTPKLFTKQTYAINFAGSAATSISRETTIGPCSTRRLAWTMARRPSLPMIFEGWRHQTETEPFNRFGSSKISPFRMSLRHESCFRFLDFFGIALALVPNESFLELYACPSWQIPSWHLY